MARALATRPRTWRTCACRLRRSRLTRLGASSLRLLRCPGCGARGCAHLAPLASLSRRGTLNPALGTHGYPDCVAGPQGVSPTDLHANQMNMVCHQRTAGAALKIGCIGDSITAGAHSSGPTKTYPAQLQAMLDPSAYAVTNLGACGSTMQKNADSPYWKRPQFTTLTSQKWDIIVIMLGTNDAKDAADGGPANWLIGECGTSLSNLTVNCPFAQDYLSMISLVRTLGTTPGVPPTIYVAAPPPLMQHGSIGANQTVINSVYSSLVPMIAAAANLTTVPISIYSALGGVPNWQETFPNGCGLNTPWPACPWYCDKQSCDQCHPNDSGYFRLASAMKFGMNL